MVKWSFLLLLPSLTLAKGVDDLNKVGEGKLNYLFWDIYLAQYYSSAPQSTKAEWQHRQNETLIDNPVNALRIKYFKSIDKQSLIEATIAQWQHLGYEENDINRWVAQVEPIWPDVEPGHTLTFRVEPDRPSQFFYNGYWIGNVEEKGFGKAFLSIWLSERTSEPKLRQALLGAR